MCSKEQYTESQEQYSQPVLKKPTMTRAKRFEQFLWQEIYDEYIRYKERLDNEPQEKAYSEYFQKYCRDLPPEDLVAKEALIHRYPLYGTSPITVWNHDGDITRDFKKRYSITKPVHEQNEQFG